MLRSSRGAIGRAALGVLVTSLVLVQSAWPASAEVDEPAPTTTQPPPPTTLPPSDDGCLGCSPHGGVNPDGKTIEAGATYPWMDGSGGGVPIPTGSSYLAGCYWSVAEAGEEVSLHPTAGAWLETFDEDNWLVWCPPQVVVYTYFPVGDPPPPFVINEMIADAYDRTPVVFFNPYSSPAGDDAIPLITQMPTYVWVDQTIWNQPVTAVAEIPGVFSVTTTATASAATWTGADEPVGPGCVAPGLPYQFGVGGDDGQPAGSCSMVYTHSSATADRELRVAVEWGVNYTCSIPIACGGPLPSITTVSSRPVVVGEIQAVEQ